MFEEIGGFVGEESWRSLVSYLFSPYMRILVDQQSILYFT